MAKFHINKHGVPAPCKAKPGNCPLGGDETHFGSREEAQEAIDKINEEKHGLLSEMNTIMTDDGVSVKEGDSIFILKKHGEEFLYSDDNEAYEYASIDDDWDFYEKYAHAVGVGEDLGIEEIIVDDNLIAYMNRTPYLPKKYVTEDGVSVEIGDKVLTHPYDDEELKFGNTSDALNHFKEVHGWDVTPDGFNVLTVNQSFLNRENYRPHFGRNDNMYYVQEDINNKMNTDLTEDNVGQVLNDSLSEGSYKLNYGNKKEDLNVDLVKVKDDKYYMRGKYENTLDSGGKIINDVEFSFTADELANQIKPDIPEKYPFPEDTDESALQFYKNNEERESVLQFYKDNEERERLAKTPRIIFDGVFELYKASK